MATTNYISLDGMLIGEMTSGVMRNYGTDALGSVVETVLNGVEENTYVYKPYGATLAKTGTAADPSFLWNGGSGYRATALSNSNFYVRRRHFSTSSARWTTTDPLWPAEQAHSYVDGNPSSAKDPSGLSYTLHSTPSHIVKNLNACFPAHSWDCSGVFTWSVTSTEHDTPSGVIIQQVVITRNYHPCSQPSNIEGVTGYEAWFVVNGKVYCDAAGTCLGQDQRNIAGPEWIKGGCPTGLITNKLEARFYKDQQGSVVSGTAGWSPGVSSGSCCSSSPGLLQNYTTPSIWSSPPDATLHDNALGFFQCCTNTPIDTKQPPPYCTSSGWAYCSVGKVG